MCYFLKIFWKENTKYKKIIKVINENSEALGKIRSYGKFF